MLVLSHFFTLATTKIHLKQNIIYQLQEFYNWGSCGGRKMQKNNLLMKGLAFIIVIFFIGLANASNINVNISNVSNTDEIEYW